MQRAEDLKIGVLSKQYMENNLESIMLIERDYPEIWLPENFLRDFPKKWELSRYAELEETPVGFVIASLKEDSISLHRFMVDPDYRDKHIGGILYSNFEAGCRKADGVKKITLNVFSDNSGAIRFYERLGYRIFDEKSLAMHYGMEKILK
ncbi:MAG: GNAT family N-acetyltransferase [Candidatus Woesearchaeota archaeon]|nr:GNAT family N-acetyltransferase [Candidatus Woesearchaeota archaeon]